MNYDVIYFSKHNISTALTATKTAVADWLLFIQEGATVADASVTYLESYVSAADKNIAAFELRQTPADTGRHTDPVTLEIDFADTAAVLVKRSAFEQVGGLDTNFIMNDYDGSVKHQADFYSSLTGIGMKVLTNQTSILVYTSNKIKDTEPDMKNGVKQISHFGACFEASSMPDAINHPHFDNTILNPGEKYSKTTIFEFSNDKAIINL